MQENVKTEFPKIKTFLEKIYHKPLEEVFAYIDPEPVGVASLAQVHKASLKDGTPVAVKIQHEKIKEQSKGDVMIVKLGCELAERLFPEFKYKWLGQEFETNLPKECDFVLEGRNADKLRKMFQDENNLVIPKIFWEYSNSQVLVMSLEEGDSITNIDYLRKNNIDFKEVATMLSNVFYRQIFELGFVHSDPHPGNIFVRKEIVNGNEVTKLILLDHGLYRDYDDVFRYHYCNLWRSIIRQDKTLLEESCNSLGVKNSKLFISILCSKSFDDIFHKDNKYSSKRSLGDIKTPEQKLKLRDDAAKNHKEITVILSSVRREMLLLLKINEFIRNIDRKIGNPINNFAIMHKFVTKELKQFETINRNSWALWRLRWEDWKFRFFYFFFRIYFWVTSWFRRSASIYDKDFNLDL